MEQQELIPHLFRTEYRKITAVLCKLFGIEYIGIAEDIASDTFLLASETWSFKGLPENPTAWLYVVAKNKAKDYLKRNALFTNKIAKQINYTTDKKEEIEIDLSEKNIFDSQLQMMFAICHPSISAEAQIGLSLRILCGFGIEEIAAAFLTNKETINKRLHRAKEKLRTENVVIEFPIANEISERLETVATTLYLLFNEGYYSANQDKNIRKELCFEAMRLTYLLIENELTNLPSINALLSLMCFHASRLDARRNDAGDIILYQEQDEKLWNKELIEKGTYFLNRAATGNKISKYHIEAGIAFWHTIKEDTPEKWQEILQLYNQLLVIEYSPIAALNRTYALAKVKGNLEAITEAKKLNLNDNHLFHTLLGELYAEINSEEATKHFEKALSLIKSNADKTVIINKILLLDKKNN